MIYKPQIEIKLYFDSFSLPCFQIYMYIENIKQKINTLSNSYERCEAFNTGCIKSEGA